MEKLTNEKEKKRLSLTPVSDKEGLFVGIKKNGVKYSVRKDRHAYFYPDVWSKLIDAMQQGHQILFGGLLQTGARIEEWLNVRSKDFDWDRCNITLYVTKSKAKKKQTKIMGGASRGFRISSQYIKKLRAYIKKNNIQDNEIIFKMSKQAVSQLLKRKLQKIGVEDWWQYSLHNIRKTTGMWLKTLQHRGKDLDISEICLRLGHDHNTFLKHYGSPSVFDDKDRDKMVEILGDIYFFK